ncbi:MAG: GspH/FimT family pseudopilin, partial [Halofilum sp. (in: g-proteobacteria)]
MKRAHGFTLIELMVTLAIVAIVATVAVPAWSDFVRANRLAATTNEFVTAVNYTRSEAVRRNTDVSLCPSTDQTSCVGNSTDWSVGWIAFVGDDPSSPGTVLRSWAGVDGTLDASGDQVIFEGEGTAAAAVTFDLQFDDCT